MIKIKPYGSPKVKKIGKQLWEVAEDWVTPYGTDITVIFNALGICKL